MFWKIFGPERDEVTGQRLHKEQLSGYYSDEKIKKNKGWEGEKYRGTHRETKCLVGKMEDNIEKKH
jgi:hypothetical protein